MVAPHQTRNISRSLIKITGSNSASSEWSSRPLLRNLVSSSLLDAAISAPQKPPTTTIDRTNYPFPPQINNNQQRKKLRPESKNDPHPTPMPKITASHIQTEQTLTPTKPPHNSASGENRPEAKLLKLKEENDQLTKTIITLMRQLALLRQLLRNPGRIQSAIRRIKEKRA